MEHTSSPIVTILTPAYNAERFICRCLDSLLAQTYTNLQIIVIDDCSTDTTHLLANDYAQRDSRIILMQTERNSGASAARNTGLAAAKGEYITEVDADDWLAPDAIEKAMAEAAEEYTDIVFSHGTGYMANDTNFNNYFGRIYQARYLAGIAAGLKSLELGNNNVGYVAAHTTDYAETASGINGFALGVQAVNPDATVFVKNLGAWADEVNEKAYAEELIKSFGCGVVSQHCDSAQPQIAAQNANVFGCGYNSDMTPDAPKAHLTAAIWNWNVYYKTAMEAAIACAGDASKFVEKMGGNAYYGGLKEGFVDVSPLSANCAANTQKAIEAVKAMMVNGEWDVFSGVKLEIVDGVVNQVEAPLMDNAGNEIVAAGGASVEDGVITGTMNYLVAGVQEA